MLRKPLQSNAKRHHLIPESYMRRFTFDGKRLHVFDSSIGSIRRDVPRNVAVESQFNSVTLKSGEKDRSAEARLAEVDGMAAKIFTKIEKGEELSREERWYVSFFVGFAETRGRGFRESVRSAMSDTTDFSQEERGFIDEQFAAAFSAASGVVLDPWTIESLVLDATKDYALGAYEIGCMIEQGLEIARHAFWSEWLVAQANGAVQFITSDRPVAILANGSWFGDDPREPFALKALPISPDHVLIFRASKHEELLSRHAFGDEVVRVVNAGIAYRADRNVIASSRKLIEQALSDALLLQCSYLGLSPQAVLNGFTRR